MTPNITASPTGALYEEDAKDFDLASDTTSAPPPEPEKRTLRLVWRNIILFAYLHLAAFYGAYLCITSAKWRTLLWAWALHTMGGLGITAGAHRLWAHRSYKAKLPLRFILMIFNTIAFQDAAVDWARDHRVHHKYSETDADPHNARRGFFFSHIGWLLCRKHPEVRTKGKAIDLSDLYQDPLLRFQKKHYLWIMPLLCFVMPTFVPWYFWGESMHNSWFICGLLRYCFTLNVTWLVNSIAHIFGHKPYDKYINPAENKAVALLAMGEGWHNYHHTFPWDYKTAELGKYSVNLTALFIDVFAKIGWAYDLKTVPVELIKKRVERTGDGTHELWGWGDKDQSQEERDEAVILSQKKEE